MPLAPITDSGQGMAIQTPDRPLPSTRWTDLLAGAHSGDERRRRDLATVIERYRTPLEHWVAREFAVNADQAEEWVAGFIADTVVEQELLGRADRTQGRLRDFLRACLRNYCLSRLPVRPGRSPRHPCRIAVTVTAPQDAPDAVFLRDWAIQTIEAMLDQMETACRESGREDLWLVFHHRLARPYLTREPATPYAELARLLGSGGPAEAHDLLVNAKRLARRVLHSIVRAQVNSDADVDDEIQFIRRVLSGH